MTVEARVMGEDYSRSERLASGGMRIKRVRGWQT
jgi:hypothetical protein